MQSVAINCLKIPIETTNPSTLLLTRSANAALIAFRTPFELPRNFITKFYKPIKESNPQLPILIREARHVEPKVVARYQFGKEESVVLYNKSVEEILETVNKLGSKRP